MAVESPIQLAAPSDKPLIASTLDDNYFTTPHAKEQPS